VEDFAGGVGEVEVSWGRAGTPLTMGLYYSRNCVEGLGIILYTGNGATIYTISYNK
jgi:hypothetical protein